MTLDSELHFNKEISCVGFIVEGLNLAFPAENIRSIIAKSDITPFPKFTTLGLNYVLGVCEVNSAHIPILDIRRFLGLNTTSNENKVNRVPIIIVLTFNGYDIAFMPDSLVYTLQRPERDALSSLKLLDNIFFRLNEFIDASFDYVDENEVCSTFFLINPTKFFFELSQLQRNQQGLTATL